MGFQEKRELESLYGGGYGENVVMVDRSEELQRAQHNNLYGQRYYVQLKSQIDADTVKKEWPLKADSDESPFVKNLLDDPPLTYLLQEFNPENTRHDIRKAVEKRNAEKRKYDAEIKRVGTLCKK